MTSHAALGVVVAGLLMALVGWPAAALGSTMLGSTAPTPTPTTRTPTTQAPTSRPTTAQPAVDVEIVAITPQVLDVTGEEHITVVARITNVSTTTVTVDQATLSLAARNMRSRAEVDGWADGTLDLKPQLLARAEPSTSLAPDDPTEVTLTVDRTARQMLDDGTLVNEWGPRGLVVEVDAGSTTGEARTFLLVKSNQNIPRAPVALLATLTGPPVAPTLPEIGASTTRALDEAARQRLEKIAGAVAPFLQIGLAVDPALVTAGDAGVLAEVLDRGRREVLTLPWADPDLQALAQAQSWDLLTQARQLAATDEPDENLVWSVDPVDDRTVAAVRATGATWMIAPSPATRTLTQASAPDGDLTVLGPDETVSSLFDGSSSLPQAQAQQLALALLATAARGTDDSSKPEPVLVVTGRDWEADAAWTQGFVAALEGAPWVRLTTTTNLMVGADDLPTATTDELAPVPDVGLGALDADRRDLAKFASVTERPALITGGVDQAMLLVASYAWRTDPAGQAAAVTTLRDAIAARRNTLYLTKRTDLTLITKKGDVRFNVRNDLPVAATVRVRLEPAKPCLRGDSRSTQSDDSVSTIWSSVVTAPPNSDTPVVVTLYAQANCQVAVQAELVGTDGAVVTTDPVEFETTVRAQLEVVGTTVVGVLLGIGLLLGVARTVRRGQSARRGDRTTTDPVRLGVLGGETPIAGIPIVKLLTPIGGIPAVKKPPDPPPDAPDETT